MRLYNYVSPGYFHTAGTRFVAGRDFTWAEIYNVRPIGIVSESLARELWGSPRRPSASASTSSKSQPWHEVVGVVEDVRENGVDQVSPATVYWPSLIGAMPAHGKSSMPGAPLLRDAHRSRRDASLHQRNAAGGVVGEFESAGGGSQHHAGYLRRLDGPHFVHTGDAGHCRIDGAALGILGIYGVISYAVSQRTREIGIRMALGAKKSELKWMFVRSALVLTGIGTAVGIGAAAGLMRLMSTLLFGISPLDPVTFAAVPVALVAAAALASYLPARRTAAVDPVEALRSE
jgi:hypothetical protein